MTARCNGSRHGALTGGTPIGSLSTRLRHYTQGATVNACRWDVDRRSRLLQFGTGFIQKPRLVQHDFYPVWGGLGHSIQTCEPFVDGVYDLISWAYRQAHRDADTHRRLPRRRRDNVSIV